MFDVNKHCFCGEDYSLCSNISISLQPYSADESVADPRKKIFGMFDPNTVK